jgi:hypothetical protein
MKMVDPTNTQQPATDENNNPLPAQGAPPAQQPSILAGSGLGQIVAGYLQHLVQNQPPPVSSVVAKAKAAADAEKPLDTTTPVPPPGSMGDKLISAGQGVMGDLADAAHASDTRGGWLSGIVNTLNARQQRLAQQQKDQALLAKTQAETIAMHRNIYQQDLATREAAYKGNQDFVDTFKVNHDIQQDVTHDELMKRAQNDKDFASNYYVRATGETPVLGTDGEPKKDKNGNPIMSPLYTVVTRAPKDGVTDDKEVSPDMSASMKKYLGSTMPPKTKLTPDQYAALDGQINLTRNAVNILNNTNGKEMSDEQLKSLSTYLNDPTIQGAISHVPGSAYAGVQEYLNNADAHLTDLNKQMQQAMNNKDQAKIDQIKSQAGDIAAERQKVSAFASQAIAPKQIEEYAKKQDDATAMLTDLQKKADGAHGEEAAAIAKSTQTMLDEGNYNAQQKAVLTRIQRQASAAAKASMDFEVDKEKQKAEVTNALNDDNVDVLVNAADNYQLDPNKLYTMRKNTNAAFKTLMLQKDPTWSEAVYKQRYNMQQDLAKDTPNSMGGQVDSLNRFAMHTGVANRGIQGLRNINSPIVNTPLNKVKSNMVGFAEAQAFKIEAETAKDEYLNFIKNGHVPPTEQEERLAAMINENRTPAELQDTFRAMAEIVGARAKGMNGRYNTIMGGGDKSIPGLLQPDSENILRQFGVDVSAITKPNELTSFSRPINPTTQKQQPQVHSTDVQRPRDLPNATATKDFKNKAGQIQTYWTDASGKPLRVVAPNELPKE